MSRALAGLLPFACLLTLALATAGWIIGQMVAGREIVGFGAAPADLAHRLRFLGVLDAMAIAFALFWKQERLLVLPWRWVGVGFVPMFLLLGYWVGVAWPLAALHAATTAAIGCVVLAKSDVLLRRPTPKFCARKEQKDV